jgi:hypothetical protein
MAGCCHQLCSCDLGTSLASDSLKAWPEMQGLAQQRTPDILAVERNFVTRKRKATSNSMSISWPQEHHKHGSQLAAVAPVTSKERGRSSVLVAFSCPGCDVENAASGATSALSALHQQVTGSRPSQHTHSVLLWARGPQDKPPSPIVALLLYAKHRYANSHVPCNLQACLRQPSQHACTNSSSIASSNMLPTADKSKGAANSKV